jgi:DNA polymerase (family 10)
MGNEEIVRILNDIADILDMKEVAWKPAAYRKAARVIEALEVELKELYKAEGKKGLLELPGVGEGIAANLEEYLRTGKVREFERLQKMIPRGLYEIMHVQGMGPKKTWKLYTSLKIDSLKKLEIAAKQGKIRKLEGFGEKSERDILMGLGMVHSGKERKLLGMVMPLARQLREQLLDLPSVERVDIAGSLRRMKETIRDIDLLVESNNPKKVMKAFTSFSQVKTILAQGDTKASVVLHDGVNCDVRVLDKKSYGSGLQYFSGSKEHGVALRVLAIKKGYKLSEYGLFKRMKGKEQFVCGETEEEIYHRLGMQYIPPELREYQGELETAQHKKLPDVVPYDALKGDLHMHTVWSDGQHSTEKMIQAAAEKKYLYVALTDHSKSLKIANGLDEKRLATHIKEIRTVAKKFPKIRVLAGSEVDILPDGRLDYADETLRQLDLVVGGVHSRFKSTSQEMTKRLLKVLDNKYLHILAHPTGRLINRREPYPFDFDKVIDKAIERDIALEINSQPSRLDLKDVFIKMVVERGGKLCVNTDSHATQELSFAEYGLGQARRGWATSKNIINTWTWQNMEKFLQR